jgi:hypothetical protein
MDAVPRASGRVSPAHDIRELQLAEDEDLSGGLCRPSLRFDGDSKSVGVTQTVEDQM